jgi:hypothetical protein
LRAHEKQRGFRGDKNNAWLSIILRTGISSLERAKRMELCISLFGMEHELEGVFSAVFGRSSVYADNFCKYIVPGDVNYFSHGIRY